jgi:CRP-like cAMP-binding protein
MAERLPQATVGVLDLPMSRSDVADHLGLTIETVCRILAHLRRDGTIAIERGRIEVRNAVGLQQMASEQRH